MCTEFHKVIASRKCHINILKIICYLPCCTITMSIDDRTSVFMQYDPNSISFFGGFLFRVTASSNKAIANIWT